MDPQKSEHSPTPLAPHERGPEEVKLTPIAKAGKSAPSALAKAQKEPEHSKTLSLEGALTNNPKTEARSLADVFFGVSITAVLAAAAYAITYAFVAGQAWYYHILPDYVNVGSPQYVGLAAIVFAFLGSVFLVINPALLGLFLVVKAIKALQVNMSDDETKQLTILLVVSAYLWQAYFMYSVLDLNGIANNRLTIFTIVCSLALPGIWIFAHLRQWRVISDLLPIVA